MPTGSLQFGMFLKELRYGRRRRLRQELFDAPENVVVGWAVHRTPWPFASPMKRSICMAVIQSFKFYVCITRRSSKNRGMY